MGFPPVKAFEKPKFVTSFPAIVESLFSSNYSMKNSWIRHCYWCMTKTILCTLLKSFTWVQGTPWITHYSKIKLGRWYLPNTTSLIKHRDDELRTVLTIKLIMWRTHFKLSYRDQTIPARQYPPTTITPQTFLHSRKILIVLIGIVRVGIGWEWPRWKFSLEEGVVVREGIFRGLLSVNHSERSKVSFINKVFFTRHLRKTLVGSYSQ